MNDDFLLPRKKLRLILPSVFIAFVNVTVIALINWFITEHEILWITIITSTIVFVLIFLLLWMRDKHVIEKRELKGEYVAKEKELNDKYKKLNEKYRELDKQFVDCTNELVTLTEKIQEKEKKAKDKKSRKSPKIHY